MEIKVSNSTPSPGRYDEVSGPTIAREELTAQRLPALTSATIEKVRGSVNIIREGSRESVPAREGMVLHPGDTLTTARGSAAFMRFNDGSIARLGEQAVFQFRKEIGSRTPNASTGTRG